MPSRPTVRFQHLTRKLALAAVLLVIAAVSDAAAQTVIVRSAPPGSKVELMTSGTATASATADTYGDATLPMPSGSSSDVQIRVDSCGNTVRVLIGGPGQAPAAEPGCTRKELWGVYAVRPVTTFVVEMNGTDATVFVAQGPPPPEWVRRDSGPFNDSRIALARAGNGLALSAGAGFSGFNRAVEAACGSGTSCESSNVGGAVMLGAEYWFKNLFAPYAAFAKPADVTVKGTGTGFAFESEQQTRLVIVGGKIGRGVGHSRVYGLAGLNRHQATSSGTQTTEATTVTVNGVAQTVAGGTQGFGQKTQGWGWAFGGGAELWMARWIALYGELNIVKIKGDQVGGGEGTIDDRATLAWVGVRLRWPVP